ncbi:anti-sigma factor [Noviherbaspirillum suwonense]|uniref:Anti-sigma-K factor RskA n=1 Tax=Noviherbaspirillum suwonense TaxID=1224511 RepID=A0ABY1QEU7_9BURK|nr:anti-sigma factor [Noviherbaspirillum suwonense]SMP65692.1 Anti-sigma-K factor RskA [Noviherbaspirillum suwonense]
MNIERNPELVDKLAAEYVLGTLRGGARRRFDTLQARHAVIRRAVQEWQDRLHPMAQFAPDAAPRPEVWDSISRQVGLRQAPGAGWLARLRDSLGFWRNLGMASTTLAALLVVVLLTRQFNAETPPSFVAMLADDRAQPVAVVTGNAHTHSLTVRLVAPQAVAADRSLELWAVPKQGNPHSLGLLAADGSITLALPADATPDTAPLLAVTLEPKGGSPKADGPTGPIVFKGAWVRI